MVITVLRGLRTLLMTTHLQVAVTSENVPDVLQAVHAAQAPQKQEAPTPRMSGFRVKGLGFEGLGCQGLGFQGLGFQGFRVQGDP